MNEEHFRRLEAMYRAAPINRIYHPTMVVSEGRAEIRIPVTPELYHAAGALHGSVYFKVLDDAAFFACNSLETQTFVLTSSFTIYLTRPVTGPSLRAVGEAVSRTRNQLIGEAVAYDEGGREVGRGSGLFVRGRTPLTAAVGYAEAGG